MFGIGMTELLVILVVALIVFGPTRLPELARSLGRAMGEFRRASTDLRQTFNESIQDPKPAPTPAPATPVIAPPAPQTASAEPAKTAEPDPAALPLDSSAMDESRLPLTEHLAELRKRLVRSILAWIAASVVAWTWKEQIFAALLAPAVKALGGGSGHLQAIAPGEIFFTYLKGALLGGFILALPVILWQAWQFIAPGLYPTEKKFAVPFVMVSTLLFVTGALFGHQFVFPIMFAFLSAFENEFVTSAWSMSEVFGMTTTMFLAFGAAFEMPVVVFFLATSGIVTIRQLLKNFPYAVLACFIIGAVLTPSTDWVSQTLLAVPMCVLYLLGVLAAWMFGGQRARKASSALTVTTPPS